MAEIPTPWSLLGAATRDTQTRLLADLQEHGYPETTKQEETE